MDNNEKLISIIIPIYNVEKYLKRCVESVVNQTYKNLEIILVDDGSPDNCGKICDEFARKDERIKVIHKKNGGLSDARNAGIDVAKGEFLSFIDSDDYVDKRFIQTMYNNLINNDADISLVKHYSFSNDEDILETKEKEKVAVLSKDEYFDQMYENPIDNVVAWNKLYKREIFDKIKYPIGKINEDEAVIHYIIGSVSKIAISNLELYYYFQREGSIMNKGKSNNFDRFDFIYDRLEYFKKHNMKNRKCYYGTIEEYKICVMQLYINNTPKEQIKKYQKILKTLMREYKTHSKKHLLKSYLFTFFPNLYFKLKKLHEKNLIRKQKKEEQKSGKKMEKHFKQYLEKQRKENKPLYLIFNTPYHGNLGDHAIAYAEMTLMKNLNKNAFYIMSRDVNYFIDKLTNYVNTEDIIFLHGGGYLGTLWEDEQARANEIITQFKNNKITFFPQTIYYGKDIYSLYSLNKDKKVYEKAEDLTILCRDEKSYKFCLENFFFLKSFSTPDIVTCLDEISRENLQISRNGIGLCYRKDKEKIIPDNIKKIIIDILNAKYPNESMEYFDTVISKNCDYKTGVKELKKLLKKISRKELVITDRLHGMIFCAITNTPCIALGNLSGKVKGAYDWLKKYNNYIEYAENENDIEEAINLLNISKQYQYNNDKLKALLVKYIKN